jgi:gliding motility-associated lipoprotein GldD
MSQVILKSKSRLKNMTRFKLILCCVVLCSSCKNNNAYYPKPKGYMRLLLPQQEYRNLEGAYPYSFQYSKHARIKKDPTSDAEPFWIWVEYPSLDAMIQLTYKPINKDLEKLDKHIADAFKLAMKHQMKASAQREQIVDLPNGRKAVVMEIEGEVPTHFQFYATDTSNHFLRGAVYLKHATLNDSLKPLVDYLKKDCMKLVETISWKKK